MELLADLLTNAKLWGYLTPAGIVAGILGYALYKLFKKYDSLQEARLKEWKQMQEEYTHLCKDINSTLDLIIKLNSKNGNSNGGSK